MAIIIQQEPDFFTSASNPVIYTFESDETAQANFSYIVELYIDGALHSTHQVFQQSGIYAKFNASEIARGLLSSPLVLDGTLVTLYDSAFDYYTINNLITDTKGISTPGELYCLSSDPLSKKE